jgi:xanthine dehydrogenase accessory factor
MNDIYPDIDRWLNLDESIGLATVIRTWGSSPRPVGAKMAFTLSGKIAGSVSGGCVEGAVFDAGVRSIRSGQAELLHFGVSDDTAFSVGLACGGQIDVFVRKLDPLLYQTARKEIESHRPFAWLSFLDGPGSMLGREALLTQDGQLSGSLDVMLDEKVVELALPLLTSGEPGVLPLAVQGKGKLECFVDVISLPPVLIIVGGVHIAIALASLANSIGYHTVVIDPRRSFSSAERFPHASQLIQAWPEVAFENITLNNTTCVAVLTHDPKIDDPALKIVLDSPVFYIGALGSLKTHRQRVQRLAADGVSQELIHRIHAPIGLDLGGTTPEETALAIMSEIVAVRHGRARELGLSKETT